MGNYFCDESIVLAVETSFSSYLLLSFDIFSHGWLPIVKKLMEGRQTRLMNVGNLSDHTPLHLAASNGQDKVVKFLLDRGATIERYLAFQ